MKFSKRIYRYRVISSQLETIPVGSALLEASNQLVYTWTWVSIKSGQASYVTGERDQRVCSECCMKGWAAPYAHDGDHGEANAPALPPMTPTGMPS